jgi:hypothetical protein
MTAGKYDFIIEQGATFRKIFRWRQSDGTTAVDLTGTTAKMQAWDDDHRNKLIDFNTQDAVTVDGPAGEVTHAQASWARRCWPRRGRPLLGC